MLNGMTQTIVTITASVVLSVGLSFGSVAYNYGYMTSTVDALKGQVSDMKPVNARLSSLETKVGALKDTLDKFIRRIEKKLE